jgi:hypothetical protein
MINDLPPELRNDENERNAYNATFYELGLHWYWDGQTYTDLLQSSPDPQERIRHYLQACQPHLLKAYEGDFLARVIQERMVQLKCVAASPCDWSQLANHEVGI